MNSVGKRRRTGARRVEREAAPRRRLGWLGRGMAACAVVVFGLVTWAIVARALAPRANTTLDHFDVLIVLGSPADADGNPSPTEQARVTEAVREYERGVAPRMIFTGSAVGNRYVEAQVMARTAEAQGIPEGVVFLEPEARDTMENACDSLKIMRSQGWTSAEVVSSASHLPRVGLILSRLPLKWRVHAAPALEPAQTGANASPAIIEILKTAHYLLWSRQMEPCAL